MDGGVPDLYAFGARSQTGGAGQIERMAVGRNVDDAHGGRNRSVVMGARIEDGEAAGRREPQAAVDGPVSAAARRIAGRALRAAQPVLISVIDRLEPLAAALGEVEELLLGDSADSTRGAQPERISIVGDIRDVIAQEAVMLGEALELAAAHGYEPAAESPDPQSPARAEIKRADLVAAELRGGDLPDVVSLDAVQ